LISYILMCLLGCRYFKFNLHESVPSSVNQLKYTTTCNPVLEFIIPTFIEGSTCFERHAAHHQEL